MKKISESAEKEIIITDALLRLAVIEKLLISKGIITSEEYSSEMEKISRQVAKVLLENANVPGDLDSVIDSINKKTTEN